MSHKRWLLAVAAVALATGCGGSTTDTAQADDVAAPEVPSEEDAVAGEESAATDDGAEQNDADPDGADDEPEPPSGDRPEPTRGVATIEVDGLSMTFPVEVICSIADFNVFFQFESEDGVSRLAGQLHMAENGDFILRHDTRITEGYVISVTDGEGLEAELKEMTYVGPAVKVGEVYGEEPGEDVGTAVITAGCG